ncbi:MAG TPA: hypothetical protein VN903_26865 [Polyangia bacterium]|nr:hypothetical protein [Polyangia bacterium]
MRTLRIGPRSFLLISVAVLTLQTCDDARPVVPLAEELATAFCTHQLSCCSPYELSLVTSDRYTTESECLPYATLAAREQLGAIEGALAQGRITVDPAALDECVKAIAGAACNVSGNVQLGAYVPTNVSSVPDLGTALKYCPNLFVGHVANNQACNLTQECVAGSRCVGGPPPPPIYNGGYGGQTMPVQLLPSPGLCIPYQKDGDRCNDSSDCEPNHSCRAPDFVCGPPNKEGDPCTTNFDPLTGIVTSGCSPELGLFCDDQSTFTCRHYPRAGDPCNFNRPPLCDPDPALALSCEQRFSGTCKPSGTAGEACGAIAIPPCRDDLACHPTQADGIGTCGAIPGLGEKCFDRCASPALCAAGVCTMPGTKRAGEPCTFNGECASLSCSGFQSGHYVCSTNGVQPRCVGAAVTVGNISGFGGMGGFGGTSGFAGSIGSGFAGSFVSGRGGAPIGGSTGMIGIGGSGNIGAGGFGGAGGRGGPPLGCQFSDFPPGDPLIADFNGPDGMPVIPIGGTFTYAAPSGSGSPELTFTNGALHFRATTMGMATAQYWGVGIFFNGNFLGTDCVDATIHTGVQFDISGTVAGTGCTAQYSTTDSAHTDNTNDPAKGSGPPGSYSPQLSLAITPATTTMQIPFTGTGAPTGGSPLVGIDKSRLTGVQWQFTTETGLDNSCEVDVTIDNVRFF